MAWVKLAVEVNAPVWRVCGNWKRFGQFPNYAKGVREVRPVGNRLLWKEHHGGKEYEAVFEINLQLERNRLQWRAISGAHNSGEASFDPVKSGGTKVTLAMESQPGPGWESASAISQRLHDYLIGFKDFVEAPTAK